MRDKIHKLEQEALQLEIDAQTRTALRKRIIRYTEQFLEEMDEHPAFQAKEKGAGIYDLPITDRPTSIDKLIRSVEKHVDQAGLNPASGGHLGYIPGGGIYPSALGDYWADITNRYAGVFFAGPGAVRMENMLIDWMAEVIGYPDTAGGNLTSGGSIANLIGIVTARDAHRLKAKNFNKTVIYLSGQRHHSVNKAIRIAGLGEAILCYIPMDEKYRMNALALEEAIRADKNKGRSPWLVIGSAGTTDTGAVDPIREIADIADRHKLWLHLDAAYGGFFALCESGQPLLQHMHRADSVVMDPHKGLFLPYGSGAILVKDQEHLFKAHHYTANYMQDALQADEEVGPADLSPELTKHFRGLRMWLPLQYYGLKPFRAALEEKIQLARYFWHEVQKVPGFEVGPEPDLSVVIYRYVPEHGDADRFNRQLTEAVQQDGRVFISSTTIDDTVYLRLAVLSFRTHLKTINLLLQVLKEQVEQLT